MRPFAEAAAKQARWEEVPLPASGAGKRIDADFSEGGWTQFTAPFLAVKGAKYVVVKNGPHNIAWTHADVVNGELVEFLK